MGNIRKQTTILLFLIVLLAVLLRVIGLDFGLPNSEGFLTSPIDAETKMFKMIRAIQWTQFQLDPKIFDDFHGEYPASTLYFYSAYFNLLDAVGLVDFKDTIADYKNAPEKLRTFWLWGRISCVAFAIATILLTFILGAKLFSEKAGLVAALILSVLPAHVIESHYWKLHVINTFLITLAALAAVNILRRGTKRDYTLFALACGLAMCAIYIGGIVAVAAIVLGCAREKRVSAKALFKESVSLRMIKVYLTAFAVFLVFNPYFFKGFFLINGKSFWNIVPKLSEERFYLDPTITGFTYMFTHLFPYAWSPVIFAMALIAIAYLAVVVRDKKVLIPLLFFAILFVVPMNTIFYNRKLSRHALALTPFMSLMVAYFWVHMPRPNFTRFHVPEWFLAKRFRYAVLGAGIAVAVFCSGTYSYLMSRQFVGEQATYWVTDHIKTGATIYTIHDYRELYPEICNPEYKPGGHALYTVVADNGFSIKSLEESKAQVVITPRLEIYGRNDKHLRNPEKYSEQYAFIQALKNKEAFGVVKTFVNIPPIFKRYFLNLKQPRDFLLTNLEIFIYAKFGALKPVNENR